MDVRNLYCISKPYKNSNNEETNQKIPKQIIQRLLTRAAITSLLLWCNFCSNVFYRVCVSHLPCGFTIEKNFQPLQYKHVQYMYRSGPLVTKGDFILVLFFCLFFLGTLYFFSVCLCYCFTLTKPKFKFNRNTLIRNC